MIIKMYEVTCDYCGASIDQYIGNKPSMKRLRSYDEYCVVKDKVFCDSICKELWERDCKEKKW